MKHSLLYRQACAQIANQQESLKWTLRNFRRLLESRLRQKFRALCPGFEHAPAYEGSFRDIWRH
jgi:hypothetical protein